jgi:membrane AbrB-like protein
MFDRKYKKAVQVIAGGLIGLSMSMDTVRRLPTIIVPALILIGSYVLVNFLIAWLMTKTRKIDYISAMFAASPGGASEFALIASEIGGESPKIAVLQIVRLLSVYTLFPILVKFMIRIFG